MTQLRTLHVYSYRTKFNIAVHGVGCMFRTTKKSVTVLPAHFAIYLSIDILQSQKFNVKNLMIN